MMQFNYNKNWYDVEFDGIKVIETKYSTHFIKSIIVDGDENPKLILDNKNIRWKNIIYINEMTKYENFLSLNKSNFLYKKILEKIGDKTLINETFVKNIVDEINNDLSIENLLLVQYDLNKIINACFELNDLGYINDRDLFDLLNKIDFDEKKLLIFDNVSYVTYNKCKSLLNNFNVLIVCNDIRGVVDNISLLELCCFVNENSTFDVINVEKLISYIETKSSQVISNEDINNYLQSKNDQKSSIINFYLKNI